MVAESVRILRETYLAILLDRQANGPLLVASPAGGTDIEEVKKIFFGEEIFFNLKKLFFYI